MRIGQRVRELRKAAGLSKDDLAARCGLSSRFLSDVESGRGNIAVTRLARLAAALGTEPSRLLESGNGHLGPGGRRPVVALLGLRGAGKSTLGEAAARELGWDFQEHDRLVEETAGMELRELFPLHGDAYYRRLARDVLPRFLSAVEHPVILATSGGIVTDAEAFDLLERSAHTIWLRASATDHWNRVVEQGDQRPMGGRPHAQEELRRLLRDRAPLYSGCAHVLDTSKAGISACRRQLVKLCRELVGRPA